MQIRFSDHSQLSQLSNFLLFATDQGFKGLSQELAQQSEVLQNAWQQGLLTGQSDEFSLLIEGNKQYLVCGIGKEEDFNAKQLDGLIKKMLANLSKRNLQQIAILMDDIKPAGQSKLCTAQRISTLLLESSYRYDTTLSKKNDSPKLQEIILLSSETSLSLAIETGVALAHGMNVAKELGNLPPNIATPVYLAKQAEQLSRACPEIKTRVLDMGDMARLGMNSFLSVAKGSVEPGRIIAMEYRGGNKDDRPYVILGKGITFDTGGISLKPGAGMDEMKYDMCGAASVLGLMHSLAELKPAINVIGVVAAAENMPAGNASKPGDVVTSMAGISIEILNTDAEGRLVLCDALTWAIKEYQPETIIDVATLTGACMMALGGVNSGLFSQDEGLAQDLLQAGLESRDPVWRLPLQDEYQDLLKSNFADIANIGGAKAGATTAACFLSRFTKGQRWAHLDIAGTAWVQGDAKGATGRPVPLLLQYLLNQIKH